MARAYNNRDIRRTCRRAAQLGREHGWCQDEWVNRDGNMCLVALVNTALGEMPDRELPMVIKTAIHNTLMATEPSYRRHVHDQSRSGDFRLSNLTLITWNDMKETTAEQVLGTLASMGSQHGLESRAWDIEARRLVALSKYPEAILVSA